MLTRRQFWTASVLAAAALSLPRFAGAADAKDPKPSAPKIEVVFCLDTTGSMKGMLDRAKEKVWSICNQIVNGKPTPDLKVGLVAFRDVGDDYVTKVYDLTDDLDFVHDRLKEFQAAGGGDIPESVNEALDHSVNKIKWSKDDDTLRMIFLVGDAPPHMDYKHDVKYPVTCEKACKLGIIINTIQCGNDSDCTKHWQEISRKAEGSYVKISQEGGVRNVVSTPFDKRLGEINNSLAKSTVVFGAREEQEKAKEAAAGAQRLAPGAAADRAGFNAKKNQNAAYDLVDALKNNKVKLEELKKEQLPEELQGKTVKEQKEILDKIEADRSKLREEAKELDKKRTAYVAEKMAEDQKKSSLDNQILEMLRKQGKKVKIQY